MQRVSDNLGKYKEINTKKRELEQIRADIFQQTNIKPTSLKIINNTLVIRAKNQYEAIELRNKYLNKRLIIKIII
jgi:hypothetical protein